MKRLNSFDFNNTNDSYTFKQCRGHYIDDMFDLHASAGTNVLGYSNPKILDKIHQASRHSNTGFWKLDNLAWTDLSNNLDQITNKQYDSFLPALSGSDSVDNAIKLAWLYWKQLDSPRKYILVRKNSFHSGSISGWQMNYSFDKSQFPNFEFVEFYSDLDTVVTKLKPENIAAVLIDTVPWVNGLQVDSKSFWNKFQTTVDQYGLILIVDEILSGMGRMGSWLHSSQYGLKPDMVTLGKALTAGHENLSVVLMNKKISKEIEHQWLPIGNSRSTNVLGAVAANATIDFIREHDILTRVQNTIIPYITELKNILDQKGIESTQAGSMLYSKDVDFRIRNHVKLNKMYHSWNHFWHLPFYDMSDSEIKKIVDIFQKI